jgi:DNA replication and repair protein RecF
MRVLGVSLRDFRSYGSAAVELGEGLTVVCGANGAGKTNLLEGLYFGCVGRSCRTSNERELVRFGAPSARVLVDTMGEDGAHQLTVGLVPGQPKRLRIDGAAVERLLDASARPLVSVFLPDRLELVKGPPAVRRAHLDQFVAALWPSRVANRRAYAQALAQRNALLSRVRSTGSGRGSVESWDAQLARHGVALMSDRAAAVEAVSDRFARIGDELGLELEVGVAYRPRSQAADAEQLAAELAQRLDRDLERGFTGHGPHRDDLALLRGGRELRAYGSQGQQRLALLALLLAEREAVGGLRDQLPLMLLDDVMSELDHVRRLALVGRLGSSGGQAVITTTDIDYVPGVAAPEVRRIGVAEGRILEEVAAA